ncbi:hypothetical protein N431DRAFT_470170 [Stipitochalara longipes BDJ]|nr:hypothetical protein N431DRAFT_470170 [Stipitochalara longipes BDJ]
MSSFARNGGVFVPMHAIPFIELDLLWTDPQHSSVLTVRYLPHHTNSVPQRSKFESNSKLMESSLHQVWESAVGNPFVPTVGKGSQFFLGFTLLTIGLLLSGLFGLNRSIINIGALGIPASLAIAFGAVYMICAVGVYV